MPVIDAHADFLTLQAANECDEASSDWENEVRQAVVTRTAGRIRGLKVVVDGSRLVISGTATTYYCKQMATQAAQLIRGHLVIQNNVTVADPRG